MKDNVDNLIRMANRIGSFFEAQPNQEENLASIATHIRNFWEPRMRRALLDFLDANPNGATANEALSEITLQAIERNKEQLRPAA